MFVKAAGVWLLFVPLAILNAALRDKVLTPLFGPRIALSLSGVVLSAFIFGATVLLIPVVGPSMPGQCWAIGAMWLVLTLAFEFLFGHYVAGDSWGKLAASLNPLPGNLFLLVLITVAIAPFAAATIRGLLE